MMFSDAELDEILDKLHGPPSSAMVRTSCLMVIEWLADHEQKTGQQLVSWANDWRPKWAALLTCRRKEDVLASIERVRFLAERKGVNPILHLEAHGGPDGLSGPGPTGAELLTWEALCDPLQALNATTNCNLLVVVAACIGYAGISSFFKGPYSPAAALAGPDSEVTPGELLEMTKEFYRRLGDDNANLSQMVASASRESRGAIMVYEPFAVFAFEALCKPLLIRVFDALLENSSLASEAVGRDTIKRLAFNAQTVWDEMFLIDKVPENGERFGVDWQSTVTCAIQLYVEFAQGKGHSTDQ